VGGKTKTKTASRLKRFGKYLAKLRDQFGMHAFEAAAKAGVSKGYWSKLETGAVPSPPSEELLAKISEMFSRPIDEVMCAAGRIPDELADYIISDPKVMSRLRRSIRDGATAAA
jgi:transcriptional regulator with XRE-family HTH domain